MIRKGTFGRAVLDLPFCGACTVTGRASTISWSANDKAGQLRGQPASLKSQRRGDRAENTDTHRKGARSIERGQNHLV